MCACTYAEGGGTIMEFYFYILFRWQWGKMDKKQRFGVGKERIKRWWMSDGNKRKIECAGVSEPRF